MSYGCILYNLGINDRKNDKGHMFVWEESEGKRGSNEIGSAILEYLNTVDLTEFDEIHTFSDCCGGQNRNRTIISLISYVCATKNISAWTYTFLESGHSLLPNDTDFGKIEKKKNLRENIFNFSRWVSLIRDCRFSVYHMKGRFLNISKLVETHTF